MRPFLLLQLSDHHIGGRWADGDPVAGLALAVESALALELKPDALLLSGDLADHGADAEYEQVKELVARLGAPTYVLPGNHDDRQVMRRHFALPGGPGTGAQPIHYAVDLGPLRLVALDSTIPGQNDGTLDGDQLGWLERTLADAPDRPTLIAMHHPPLLTGSGAWDRLGLAEPVRASLAAVVARHHQVQRIVAGHLHRAVVSDLAGCSVLAVPSTYVQGRFAFDSPDIMVSAEPAAFAVHVVVDGKLISHIQPVSGRPGS